MSEIVSYEHHGAEVKVMKDLKGKHRAHCLCYECDNFHPESENSDKPQCPIAEAVYQNCVDYNLVTPVWECPAMIPGEKRY